MPLMRTIVTLAIAVVLAVLAAWAITVLPWYRALPLPSPQRTLLPVAAALVLTIAIAWLLFVLPAYWD